VSHADVEKWEARLDITRLIQQVRDGDDTAGPILVSVIAPRLLGYAELIASDLPLADREEAVERAIETAIRRIDRYDPSRGTFPGWVRGFVRHAIGDWRRQHPDGAPAALDQIPEHPGPEVEDPESELASPASASLAALVLTEPEPDQLLLRLRFEEGLTHTQIAEQLGVSEAACRKRLERLLNRLRARAKVDPDSSRFSKGEDA
jgi:RNA polymerase sigma-70 factor (ECF subfamily)